MFLAYFLPLILNSLLLHYFESVGKIVSFITLIMSPFLALDKGYVNFFFKFKIVIILFIKK